MPLARPVALAMLALCLLTACGNASVTRVTPRPVDDLTPPPTVGASQRPAQDATPPGVLPTLPPTPTMASAAATFAPAATQAASPAPHGTAAAPAPTHPATATIPAPSSTPVPTPAAPTPTPAVTLEVILLNYRFDPAELRVRSGETVRLVLRNTDRLIHALQIPDAGFSQPVGSGSTVDVNLHVDLPAGSYYFYCPIQEEGNHEDLGMVGTLIVEAAP